MNTLCVVFSGPCGGKTTGQSRLCTFFENLGWKVSVVGGFYWGNGKWEMGMPILD